MNGLRAGQIGVLFQFKKIGRTKANSMAIMYCCHSTKPHSYHLLPTLPEYRTIPYLVHDMHYLARNPFFRLQIRRSLRHHHTVQPFINMHSVVFSTI